TQPDFDRVKPIVEKMNRRLRFRLQSRRRRAIVGHGVVSTGAPTPALIWVSPPGDYAIVNSNHIPDGTRETAAAGQSRAGADCATHPFRRERDTHGPESASDLRRRRD